MQAKFNISKTFFESAVEAGWVQRSSGLVPVQRRGHSPYWSTAHDCTTEE